MLLGFLLFFTVYMFVFTVKSFISKTKLDIESDYLKIAIKYKNSTQDERNVLNILYSIIWMFYLLYYMAIANLINEPFFYSITGIIYIDIIYDGYILHKITAKQNYNLSKFRFILHKIGQIGYLFYYATVFILLIMK